MQVLTGKELRLAVKHAAIAAIKEYSSHYLKNATIVGTVYSDARKTKHRSNIEGNQVKISVWCHDKHLNNCLQYVKKAIFKFNMSAELVYCNTHIYRRRYIKIINTPQSVEPVIVVNSKSPHLIFQESSQTLSQMPQNYLIAYHRACMGL